MTRFGATRTAPASLSERSGTPKRFPSLGLMSYDFGRIASRAPSHGCRQQHRFRPFLPEAKETLRVRCLEVRLPSRRSAAVHGRSDCGQATALCAGEASTSLAAVAGKLQTFAPAVRVEFRRFAIVFANRA